MDNNEQEQLHEQVDVLKGRIVQLEDALRANRVFHTPLARLRRPDKTWNEYELDAIRRTNEILGE